MAATATKTLQEVLNKQVANWTVLYTKLHNYHWYVKGDQFFTLHAKFEELYDTAALNMDELAERLLAIGGKPVGTLAECLKEASVQEASGQENANQMVRAITMDFRTMADEMKTGIKMATEQGDDVTTDLLIAMVSELEKQNWMLQTFLA